MGANLRILAVGGAGYVGSHVVRECRRAGHEPVVFDSFSTGHPESVEGVEQIHGDLLDVSTLQSAFENDRFDAVFHVAAISRANGGHENPMFTYRNNVAGTLNLLHAMLNAGVERLIFSSSAAVYGRPQQIPIPEEHDALPESPFGASLAVCERALADIERVHPLRSVVLRHFNVAGADLAGDIGQDHRNGCHLMPALFQVALGRRPHLEVFGDDHDTPDGTCIRDFVHVTDVARAHLLALERFDDLPPGALNLGVSEGFSVQEVIDEARQLIGDVHIEARVVGRRALDAPVLVAACERAREALGWTPQFSDLRTIVESAWNWHRRHPGGYRSDTGGKGTGSERSELFGDIAVRLGFVEPDDVASALDRQEREMESGNQHKLIGMHMLEMGLLSTSQLIEILKFYEER